MNNFFTWPFLPIWYPCRPYIFTSIFTVFGMNKSIERAGPAKSRKNITDFLEISRFRHVEMLCLIFLGTFLETCKECFMSWQERLCLTNLITVVKRSELLFSPNDYYSRPSHTLCNLKGGGVNLGPDRTGTITAWLAMVINGSCVNTCYEENNPWMDC